MVQPGQELSGEQDFVSDDWTPIGSPLLLNQVDVSEVYGERRLVKIAQEMGLTGGSCMDIRTADEYGRRLDFDSATMRNHAVRRSEKEQLNVSI